jgi:hypothetical protein
MTAKEAIYESIVRNRIVTIDYDPHEYAYLEEHCDNSVDNGLETEFWGRDEDGDDWRVHLVKSR